MFFVLHSADSYLKKYGSEGWQLHSQMQSLAGELIMHKRQGNSFENTNLQEQLIERGVSRVVVTGMVTHGCVKATCLGAQEAGYKVALAGDAHSNFSKDAAKVIEKWNLELGNKGVLVVETKSISFQEV